MSQVETNDEVSRQPLFSQRFLTQVGSSLGMRVAAAGLTFAMGIVVARSLGLSGYGEYALAISWMNILVILAKFGFDTTSLRFLAQYRSRGEASLLRGFATTSRRLTFVTSLVMSVLMAGVTLLLREWISAGFFWCLLAAAGLLPVMVGIQLREAGLLAFGRVMTGQTNGVLTPLLLITFVLTLPLLTGERLSPPVIVLLQLTSALATLGFVALTGRRTLATVEDTGPTEVHTVEWLHVAAPILLVQFLNLLQNQSGTILCGTFLDSDAAGLFNVAARVAGVLFLGLQAINMIAAPTISSLYHSGQKAELERFVKTCSLASCGFALAFLVVMLPLGKMVLGIAGDEFVVGYVPMVVMIAGLAIASAAGPVTQFLLMTGHQWDCIKVFSANVAVCMTAAVFIIPRYGVLGAAAITAFARLSSYAAMVLVVKHRHNIWCVAGLPAAATASPVDDELAPEKRMAA